MATNKKKDAASLFELIDKSTLKVPKTGALKIPAWYSSKTNPPTQSAPGTTGVHVSGAANGSATPTVREIKPAVKVESKPEPKLEAKPEIKAEVAPLFSSPTPEPVSAPTSAPSAPVATPAPQLTPKTIAPFGTTHVEKPAMTPIPPQKGIFAPVVPGSPHHRKKVIYLSAACGAVALVLLIIIISRLGKSTPVAPTLSNGSTATTGGARVQPPGGEEGKTIVRGPDESITQPINGGGVVVPTTIPNNGGIVAPPINNGKGTITDSKTIDWSQEPKDLRYIMIASYSTQREELANKAAQLLADNGVDVVMLKNNEKQAIRIFTRHGFPETAATEAEAALAKIRKIGELHPDFKKTGKSVFATPYLAKLERR